MEKFPLDWLYELWKPVVSFFFFLYSNEEDNVSGEKDRMIIKKSEEKDSQTYLKLSISTFIYNKKYNNYFMYTWDDVTGIKTFLSRIGNILGRQKRPNVIQPRQNNNIYIVYSYVIRYDSGVIFVSNLILSHLHNRMITLKENERKAAASSKISILRYIVWQLFAIMRDY